MVLCKACDKYLQLLGNGDYHDQSGHDMVMMILDYCKEPKSVLEIMEKFGFERRTSFRRKPNLVMIMDKMIRYDYHGNTLATGNQ